VERALSHLSLDASETLEAWLSSHSLKIAHAGTSLHALRRAERAQRRRGRSGHHTHAPHLGASGWELAFDGLLAAVMLAAVVCLVLYSHGFSQGSLPVESQISVYDADGERMQCNAVRGTRSHPVWVFVSQCRDWKG
jgi:hypothetical protein